MRGRKRLNTEVKKAQGTLEKSRINENAPEMIAEIPAVTDVDGLSEVEREAYDELSITLFDRGVITRYDRLHLVDGAILLTEFRKLAEAVRNLDKVTYEHEDREGNKVVRTYARELRKDFLELRREWSKWMQESGLTPATREKVSKTLEEKKSNKRIELD